MNIDSAEPPGEVPLSKGPIQCVVLDALTGYWGGSELSFSEYYRLAVAHPHTDHKMRTKLSGLNAVGGKSSIIEY